MGQDMTMEVCCCREEKKNPTENVVNELTSER